MNNTRRIVVTMALAVLIAGVCSPVSTIAADNKTASTESTASIPLRSEISMQYGQSSGEVKTIDGSADVCVPWKTSDGILTGNADNNSMNCHSLLLHPTEIGVYPLGSPSNRGSRVLMQIASVGNQSVKLRGVLDTGSGGLALNALQIFPSSIVSSNGFVFKANENQIEYNGIIVTKLKATRVYGGASFHPSYVTGNLGFAHVSLGTKGEIKTALIPILFVYYNSNKPINSRSGDIDNIIGINGVTNPIGRDVSFEGSAGANNAYTAGASGSICTLHSTSTCDLMSPLRSLSFGPGVRAGYILKSFPLDNCSVNVNDCKGKAGNYLVVGLDKQNTEGFSSTQLRCVIPSSDVKSCIQIVANVNISVGENSFMSNVVFDSGAPMVRIAVPSSLPFPPPSGLLLPADKNVTVILSAQPPFTYSFTTGKGPSSTVLEYIDTTRRNRRKLISNLGIEFFTHNSIMLDYDNGIEGWKPSSTLN